MGIFQKYIQGDKTKLGVPPSTTSPSYEPKELKDWKTDLRYLRFELDRKDGASSNQPYAQFPVPGPYPTKLNKIPTISLTGATTYLDQVNQNTFLSGYRSNFNLRKTFIDLYNANAGPDFPIRGGGSYDVGAQFTTLSGQIDRQRISSFLYDLNSPKGKLFIDKQKKLQFSNPNIETGEGIVIPPSSQDKTSLKSRLGALLNNGDFPAFQKNTRVYNENNTLLQVAGMGTGQHALRAGFSPFDLGQDFYEKTVGMQLFMDLKTAVSSNRLTVLYQYKLANGNPIVSTSSQDGLKSSSKSLSTVNKLGISMNNLILFDYPGGPNSAYGIGFTTIRRFTNTSPVFDKPNGETTFVGTPVTRVRTGLAMSYEAISKQTINSTNSPGLPRVTDIQDFKEAQDPIYKIRDRETLYYGPGQTDNIGENEAVELKSGDNPWVNTEDAASGTVTRKKAANDQIKFGFECINYDGKNNIFLQFRAFLTNGLQDNHQASWSNFKYSGRGEDFYTYNGFSRNVTFGFKVLVENPEYLLTTYRKLNYLVSQVYPDYSPTTNIMRAPIVRLTVGDYLYRVPGIMTNVNITVDQAASWTNPGIDPGIIDRWENEEGNKTYQYESAAQMPQYVSVQITFNPILDVIPQRSKPGQLTPLFMNIGEGYDKKELTPKSSNSSEETVNWQDRKGDLTGQEQLDILQGVKRDRRRAKRVENRADAQANRQQRRSERAGRRDNREDDRLMGNSVLSQEDADKRIKLGERLLNAQIRKTKKFQDRQDKKLFKSLKSDDKIITPDQGYKPWMYQNY